MNHGTRQYLWYLLIFLVLLVVLPLACIGARGPERADAFPDSLKQFQVLGYADLYDSRAGKIFEGRFYCSRNTETFQVEFVIEPVRLEVKFNQYRYLPEIGQEQMISAYPMHFGEGDLIVSLWSWGATSLRMKIFRLGRQGEVEMVFDQIAKSGFQIVNVSGGSWPDIVSAPDNPNDKKKHARIYSWDGERFQLSKTVEVSTMHRYSITSN